MKIAKKLCYIYALCEPDGNFTVRYVGKTEIGLEARYKYHISESQLRANTHKNNWIKKLLSAGQHPLMVELECVPVGEDWEARERYWIAYYRELGYSLTNATDGGEGMSGHHASDESRAKMSEAQRGNKKSLGKKQSAASNEKRRKAMTGRKPSEAALAGLRSPEAQEKRLLKLRGRKLSPQHRARISELKMGNKNRLGQSPSEETRAKIRAANVGKKLSDETKAKMSAVRKGRKPSENNRRVLNSPEVIAKRSETRRRKTQLKQLCALISALAMKAAG